MDKSPAAFSMSFGQFRALYELVDRVYDGAPDGVGDALLDDNWQVYLVAPFTVITEGMEITFTDDGIEFR